METVGEARLGGYLLDTHSGMGDEHTSIIYPFLLDNFCKVTPVSFLNRREKELVAMQALLASSSLDRFSSQWSSI